MLNSTVKITYQIVRKYKKFIRNQSKRIANHVKYKEFNQKSQENVWLAKPGPGPGFANH